MNQNERFKNAVIYGTSHPEIYMTKADELWQKYGNDLIYGQGNVRYEAFLAALAEYGQAVRDRDAEIAQGHGSPTLTIGMAGAQSFANRIAAAIEHEPLP